MFLSLAIAASLTQAQPATLNLVPTPQSVQMGTGWWEYSGDPIILGKPGDADDRFAASQVRDALSRLPKRPSSQKHGHGRILMGIAGRDKAVDEELSHLGLKVPDAPKWSSYVLVVGDQDDVLVAGKDTEGLFYGAQTLCQIIQANAKENALPRCTIRDWPALKIRAWQDDISRGPIPTMETLKREIRTMAGFKCNAFTMYTEHVFKLKKHPTIAPPDGITADQVKELCRYAKPYHVQVIGNFQSFGHFANILSVPGYEKLGENGWVISPAKPESYEFLKDVYSEIAPAYDSELFDINCDEVGGLGEGASKQMVQEMGLAGVYASHINKIAALLKPYGKTPMMWGDIALAYRDIVPKLPPDLVVLSWGYHPGEDWNDYIKPFTQLGFRFMVCPGVSCWGQIFPDFDNAAVNISNFTRDGYSNGALGMLNTTWDDTGENLWNFNWLPLAWGAECAWHPAVPVAGQDRNALRNERYQAFNKAFGQVYYGPQGDKVDEALQALSRLRKNPVSMGMSDGAFWTNLPTLATRGFKESEASKLIADAQAVMDALPVQAPNQDTLEYARFAARRMRFMGKRVLMLGELQNAQAPDQKKSVMASLEDLARGASSLRDEYASLWHRENRNWWLDRIAPRYDRLISELKNAATAPTFKPSSDAVGTGIDVQIEALSGAPVHYTVDGSEPTAASPRYTRPVHVTATTRFRARSFPMGKPPSSIVERTYHALSMPATIATSMSTHEDHRPESAFDGDDATYFWSEGDPGTGATFTVSLNTPTPLNSIRVVTGHPDHPEDYAHHAVLEVTGDGQSWQQVADFANKGIAEASLAGQVIKAFRIRTTAQNGYWLVIREIHVK